MLLVVLLVLCIQDFGGGDVAGLLHLPATVASGQWDVRVAIGIAAVWLAVSSIPLFVTVPEAAPRPLAQRQPARGVTGTSGGTSPGSGASAGTSGVPARERGVP